ncbi:hypothetical protein HN748_03500 [Candidatus Peregrinibacteria bacterium]|jgi:hypothetical protein|nr:hypothetical protein [Candidatus Peregrinibacteria bacterium]MBT7703274.1 hypothetical protein [Candidatus Peregrinibacteria bacterium]
MGFAPSHEQFDSFREKEGREIDAALTVGETTEEVEAKEVEITYMIGETRIKVVMYEKPGSSLTFFNMHDNEDTAANAARDVVDSQGGRLIELRHTGDRNLDFEIHGEVYTIDPNRMFTDVGAAASLRQKTADYRGMTYKEEALRLIRNFANGFIADFSLASPERTLVAVHNNTDNRYSLKSYQDGGQYESDAELVFSRGGDLDDFFYVTDRAVFDYLKAAGMNVVLQDNSRMTDDGSLSVYCGQNGITYVNAEAQHGHLAQQKRMLEVISSRPQP